MTLRPQFQPTRDQTASNTLQAIRAALQFAANAVCERYLKTESLSTVISWRLPA